MTILITGGAGFIGSHVVDALLLASHKVIVVDDYRTGNNKRKGAIYTGLALNDAHLGDIFAQYKPEVICHFAAQVSVPHSITHPKIDAETNIIDSIRLLELAKRFDVSQLIFASSGGAITGDADVFPTPEPEDAFPLSPYGVSKQIFEQYLWSASATHGMKTVILRMANIYGPRQATAGEAGVVAAFLQSIKAKKPLTIFGDGESTRDFTYVKDVANVVEKIIRKKYTGMAHISTGIETSVNELAEQLSNIHAKEVIINYEEARSGEVRRSVLLPSRAKEQWGVKCKTPLALGLQETYDWYMKKRV